MRDTGVTHKLFFKVQNQAFSLIEPVRIKERQRSRED